MSHADPQRALIDFDSESPAGRAFVSRTTVPGLSRFTEIPWPDGQAPVATAARGGRDGSLPRADVLIVTWTVEEGHALSRVLTPGKDSRDDYRDYTHNFDAFAKRMRVGCPAVEAGRLGTWWCTRIGDKRVVVFKSDSHMSQDGLRLPNIDVWKQIIAEVRPRLVITTGTSGGIGKEFEVGDVVVSPVVRFDCVAKFGREPFGASNYSSAAPNTTHFDTAKRLTEANAARLPKDNTRAPRIVVVAPYAVNSAVVTTDFFGFDTSDDHYRLQGLGDVSEMGDAVLGLVCSQLGRSAPRWVSVRNVSDPQIRADGLTLAQQAALAAQIYKGFGRWSSVGSAVVCWGLVCGE